MLSLVFATHNGEATLARTLDGFTRLVPPPGGWKLIVVDNASTDSTRAILDSFVDGLPLQIIDQPAPGKNRALNAAIAHIEGDLVVFTDDDVVAESDWLVVLRRTADAQAEFDVFGGVIRPLWPEKPPDWLLNEIPIRIVYAITHEDLREGPVHPGRVWGPNMAVRRTVFDAGHRFDEAVGPQPGQYRMGSETEFTVRLAGLGHRAWHSEHALVHHIIRPGQMEPDWIVKRGYRFGRDMFWKENDPALAEGAQQRSAETTLLLGLPRWYFTRYLAEVANAAMARVRGDFPRLVKARWEISYWHGYFAEAFGPGSDVRRGVAAGGDG